MMSSTLTKIVLGVSLAANLTAVNVIYHQYERLQVMQAFVDDARDRVEYLSTTIAGAMAMLAR